MGKKGGYHSGRKGARIWEGKGRRRNTGKRSEGVFNQPSLLTEKGNVSLIRRGEERLGRN